MSVTYLPVSKTTITCHIPWRDHSHRFRTFEVEAQFKGIGACYWPPNVAVRERIRYWNHINICLVILWRQYTDIMHHGVGTFQLINNGLVVEENVLQRTWNQFNRLPSIFWSRHTSMCYCYKYASFKRIQITESLNDSDKMFLGDRVM